MLLPLEQWQQHVFFVGMYGVMSGDTLKLMSSSFAEMYANFVCTYSTISDIMK